MAIEAAADRARAGQWGLADLDGLEEELGGARADLLALKAEVEPLLPLCPYLRWLPRFGGDIQAAPHLLEMGLRTSGAGELVLEGLALEGLEPLLSTLQEGHPPPAEGLLERGMEVLLAAQPQLLAAQAELNRASQARQEVDEGRLSPYTARLVARLDEYLPLAQFGVQGALLAPELLGASGARSYLVLAQNEDELRATGGFISGVGLLRVHEGRILDLSFQDSYAIRAKAEAEPPGALEKTMWAQIWLLRDANWSPDFPTAAKVAAEIYGRDQGVSLDGVIAADQQAMRLLLEALGPVKVEGWEQSVTCENFISVIRAAWAPKEENQGQWWGQRKDFMGAIAGALARKLEIDPGSINPLKLARAIQQALEERHILLYVEEPRAAELLAEKGWDGAILPTAGDYLMVVDSNVGFNKVNPKVAEEIDYRVQIQEDGALRADLTLSYRNGSTREVSQCVQEARYDDTYEGMMDRCYWDYLRVYVPQGSQLLGGTRNPLPPGSLHHRMGGGDGGTGEPTLGPGEGGKDVLATFFVVPPGESREVRLSYESPGKVDRGGKDKGYSLLIQKQPGTSALPVRVEVELPPSARMLGADPEPSGMEGGVLAYTFRLSTTTRLEILFDWE